VIKMATAAKYMWVANLVEPWGGDPDGPSAYEFFEATDDAAEMVLCTHIVYP
jgi:hypothetical protein